MVSKLQSPEALNPVHQSFGTNYWNQGYLAITPKSCVSVNRLEPNSQIPDTLGHKILATVVFYTS